MKLKPFWQLAFDTGYTGLAAARRAWALTDGSASQADAMDEVESFRLMSQLWVELDKLFPNWGSYAGGLR